MARYSVFETSTSDWIFVLATNMKNEIELNSKIHLERFRSTSLSKLKTNTDTHNINKRVIKRTIEFRDQRQIEINWKTNTHIQPRQNTLDCFNWTFYWVSLLLRQMKLCIYAVSADRIIAPPNHFTKSKLVLLVAVTRKWSNGTCIWCLRVC